MSPPEHRTCFPCKLTTSPSVEDAWPVRYMHTSFLLHRGLDLRKLSHTTNQSVPTLQSDPSKSHLLQSREKWFLCLLILTGLLAPYHCQASWFAALSTETVLISQLLFDWCMESSVRDLKTWTTSMSCQNESGMAGLGMLTHWMVTVFQMAALNSRFLSGISIHDRNSWISILYAIAATLLANTKGWHLVPQSALALGKHFITVKNIF